MYRIFTSKDSIEVEAQTLLDALIKFRVREPTAADRWESDLTGWEPIAAASVDRAKRKARARM
jgi:hypothetical protein